MTQEKICQDCSHQQKCQEIYEKLGNIRGPSVAFKAVVAFLLPILVFIASLAVFDAILGRAGLSFVLALSVTFALILIIKGIKRRVSNNK
jgi:hypothetical protein